MNKKNQKLAKSQICFLQRPSLIGLGGIKSSGQKGLNEMLHKEKKKPTTGPKHLWDTKWIDCKCILSLFEDFNMNYWVEWGAARHPLQLAPDWMEANKRLNEGLMMRRVCLDDFESFRRICRWLTGLGVEAGGRVGGGGSVLLAHTQIKVGVTEQEAKFEVEFELSDIFIFRIKGGHPWSVLV